MSVKNASLQKTNAPGFLEQLEGLRKMNQTQNSVGRSDFSTNLVKAQKDIQKTQRDLGFSFPDQ